MLREFEELFEPVQERGAFAYCRRTEIAGRTIGAAASDCRNARTRVIKTAVRLLDPPTVTRNEQKPLRQTCSDYRTECDCTLART